MNWNKLPLDRASTWLSSLLPLYLGLTAVMPSQSQVTAQETQPKVSDTRLDAESLTGEWRFVSGMRVGEKVGEERLGTVKITDKIMTLPVPDSEPFVMHYKLDSSKSPVEVDFEIKEGPGAPSTALGILAMEKGQLKLCYHPTGGERPQSFESSEDNGCNLFVLARAGFAAADLVGTWNYASGTRAGQPVDTERLESEVIINDKTVTLPLGEGMQFVMSYQLDLSQTPTAIDMKIEEGPQVGGEAKGIVKKEGDHLWLCYHPFGGERPAAFESTEDNGCFLFKLKPSK